MTPDQVIKLIQSAIDGCEVKAQIDGNHVTVVAVSEHFEGLNAVKKQQLVYAALQETIASGEIHAVHMKTYTPAQWADLNA